MTEIKDAPGLLLTAVQDLHDGECALIERLPAIVRKVSDPAFAGFLADDITRSRAQAGRLEEIAGRLGGAAQAAPNIWLRAIIDDAQRDCEMIEHGVLLDIALVGAIRKAKQAERVSYETAIALSDTLSRTDEARLLRASCDEESEADACLLRLLYTLASRTGSG
jgi:ferritin-like metal-binding protein YciE